MAGIQRLGLTARQACLPLQLAGVHRSPSRERALSGARSVWISPTTARHGKGASVTITRRQAIATGASSGRSPCAFRSTSLDIARTPDASARTTRCHSVHRQPEAVLIGSRTQAHCEDEAEIRRAKAQSAWRNRKVDRLRARAAVAEARAPPLASSRRLSGRARRKGPDVSGPYGSYADQPRSRRSRSVRHDHAGANRNLDDDGDPA